MLAVARRSSTTTIMVHGESVIVKFGGCKTQT